MYIVQCIYCNVFSTMYLVQCIWCIIQYVPKKVQENTLTFLGLPVVFITYGHVRDTDKSRWVSAARWQHATLMDYEVPLELKRVPLD